MVKNISVLEVNLSAIKNNIASIKRLLKYNQKLCIVAKANCYGLGAKVICKSVNNLQIILRFLQQENFMKLEGL